MREETGGDITLHIIIQNPENEIRYTYVNCLDQCKPKLQLKINPNIILSPLCAWCDIYF